MSRIYLASSNGWVSHEQAGDPPTASTIRLTSASASTDNVVTPPPPTGTMFGWNSAGTRADELWSEWGVCPITRLYPEYTALTSSLFSSGGMLYKGVGLNRTGVTVNKRVNMSIKFDPGPIASGGTGSAKAQEVYNFVKNVIPDDWYCQIVLHHEYNLHMHGGQGDGTIAGTMAEFIEAQKILGERIYAADLARPTVGKSSGRAIPVINPAQFGFTTDEAAWAGDMPPTTQFHYDIYSNPTQVQGHRNYGSPYRNAQNMMDGIYAQLTQMGYLPGDGTYGWGVNEFNAPRRVAPRLATLNTTYGWGPLSPHDIDGSGQAQAIRDYANYALNAPIPATTFIMFITKPGTASASWNQDFWTGGASNYDAPVGDPLHQNWPINTDSTLPVEAYRQFINISA